MQCSTGAGQYSQSIFILIKLIYATITDNEVALLETNIQIYLKRKIDFVIKCPDESTLKSLVMLGVYE